ALSACLSLSSLFSFPRALPLPSPFSFPTRRSSDLIHFLLEFVGGFHDVFGNLRCGGLAGISSPLFSRSRQSGLYAFDGGAVFVKSEEHTSELQSLAYLVCRLLLEKKKIMNKHSYC